MNTTVADLVARYGELSEQYASCVAELAALLGEAERADTFIAQQTARVAELEAALSSADDVAKEYGDESDQYRHKLAAAEERIAELEAQLSAIPVLVEWLLDEAQENERGYLAWRDTNSRRQFMQRLREEMEVANAAPGASPDEA